MYGAIFGDIVGSSYEFDRGEKTKLFRLFTEESTYTDDTVMTLAVASALLEAGPTAEPEAVTAAVAKWMRALGNRYPNAGYGGMFARWLSDPAAGAYGSYGNGSAMRVSPVGWYYDTIERTREIARATALPTHDHPEGIKGAEAVASVIFLARNGWTRESIRAYVRREFGYDLSRTLDDIRPNYKMDATCQGSVPEAITAFLEAEDFEDAVRGAVSLGGDTDTTACMAGAMAEAYFPVPEEFREEVEERLPDELLRIFKQAEKLRDALRPRHELPAAIAAYNAKSDNESLTRVLNALAIRIKAGGALFSPIELPEAEHDAYLKWAAGEGIDPYAVPIRPPLPKGHPARQALSEGKPLKDIKEPMPQLHPARRSIATNDGKRWAVAFSSEEELRKKSDEPTLYAAEPAVFALQLASKLPDCAGMLINPWGERFFATNELIAKFLEQITPKNPKKQ